MYIALLSQTLKLLFLNVIPGKPALFRDVENIDWVPSLRLDGLGRKEADNNSGTFLRPDIMYN
jgi:hypothetical protein